MKKYIAIAIVLVSVSVGSYLFFNYSGSEKSDMVSMPTEMKAVEPKDITENADFENRPLLIIGDTNAPVTLVEYADFKCPQCNKFHREAGAQIRSEYIDTGKVKIEYRNFPFIGPDSGRAARGTYCANNQGVFTEYHDRVFSYVWENHYKSGNLSAEFEDVLTVDRLTSLMQDKLTDLELFKTCLEDTQYNKFIDAELLLGAADEINGTPGFVINEKSIIGPQNFTTFKTLIEIAL